jgi:hypothetical protein
MLGDILAIAIFVYLLVVELLIPFAKWVIGEIPEGWEDEDGFHYGRPNP